MPLTRDHFVRAAADIAAHGDNDMLPFDIDTRFIADNQDDLADIAFNYHQSLAADSIENTKNRIASLTVFNERLLSPAGPSGFRVATKISPFWNLYFNGLGIAVAEALAPKRYAHACSYRYLNGGGADLFDRKYSWRAFRSATAAIAKEAKEGGVVVQTDISSYYAHISHHYLEDQLGDLLEDEGRVGKQIVGLLTKFSGGRSFGLPVGGQGARALAELMLQPIDAQLTTLGIHWLRYVDDYVVFADTSADAYGALSKLSHVLGNYGLSLSRNKTSVISAKHYAEYVASQLGDENDEASKLKEIDVFFDPYSGTAVEEYDSLRETVESLHVERLLSRELEKSLPDNFLVTQIGRTLRLHSPAVAAHLTATLLGPDNLHAFRSSWSSIMRGVASLRGSSEFQAIHDEIDRFLDAVPSHSSHLLQAEASLIHYLRTLRFANASPRRAVFVRRTYDATLSESVRRACVDCWRNWRDRPSFTMLRNRWNQLGVDTQRIVWLASFSMGDEGDGLRRQFKNNTDASWALGIEKNNVRRFSSVYRDWCDNVTDAIRS